MSCIQCSGTGYVWGVPKKSKTNDSPAVFCFLCNCSAVIHRKAIPRWCKAASDLYRKVDFLWEVDASPKQDPAKAALTESTDKTTEGATSSEDDILKAAWTSKNWQEQAFRTVVEVKGKEWVKARIATLRASGYI
jgi:hypothetical protein